MFFMAGSFGKRPARICGRRSWRAELATSLSQPAICAFGRTSARRVWEIKPSTLTWGCRLLARSVMTKGCRPSMLKLMTTNRGAMWRKRAKASSWVRAVTTAQPKLFRADSIRDEESRSGLTISTVGVFDEFMVFPFLIYSSLYIYFPSFVFLSTLFFGSEVYRSSLVLDHKPGAFADGPSSSTRSAPR